MEINIQILNNKQSTDYELKKDSFILWNTPILYKVCDNYQSVNKELNDIINQKEKSNPGVNKSNEGGWHSNEDLLSWGGNAIVKLQSWIVDGVGVISSSISDHQDYTGKLELNAWANINTYGNYNNIHTHPACTWSGVYYVKVGDQPSGEYPKSGVIEFLDPRAGSEMVATPTIPFGREKIISPKNGEIIIFPSWLKHWVHPYWGLENRVSIAFNVRLR